LTWASEGFLPREAKLIFQVMPKNIFSGGPKVVKFYFALSKLSKHPLFAKTLVGKCQISKFGVGQGPPFPARMFIE